MSGWEALVMHFGLPWRYERSTICIVLDVLNTIAAFVSILHSCDFFFPFPSTFPFNMCFKTEIWNQFKTIRLLMMSTEVRRLFGNFDLILSEQRTSNVMQHLLCTQHARTHTHTGFSLNWCQPTVTIRMPQLFTKREPNLLFSVLPFISLSHPVFWPSTILFVASPPSASAAPMTPSQFPAFLSAPVSSCFCRCLFVTFLFPQKRKFLSCL